MDCELVIFYCGVKNTLNYYTESYWKICGVPSGPLESFPSLTPLATALQSTRVCLSSEENAGVLDFHGEWLFLSFCHPVCSVCTLCSLMASCRRLSIRPAHWLDIVCCDLCLMNERKLMPACVPSLWPCVCLCETRFCTCFGLKRCNTTQTVSSEKLSMMKQQLSSVNPSKLSDH